MKIHFCLFFFSILYSQPPHPLEFFPHHQGDIFEYQYGGGSENWFQNIVLSDTLGSDGKYYLQTTRYGKWAVDTSLFEVYNGPTLGLLKFKLDADSGDSWTVYRYENGGVQKAKVRNIFRSTYLGENITVKVIDYSDSATGLFITSFWLATKFGIIAEYGDPPGIPIYFLRGAKINGQMYGKVTSVEQKKIKQNMGFTLHQNFPNPFNPSTTISFDIVTPGDISIKVYDLLGREVAQLVQGNFSIGSYKFIFESGELPSGIYIYKLSSNDKSISKKMLLIR